MISHRGWKRFQPVQDKCGQPMAEQGRASDARRRQLIGRYGDILGRMDAGLTPRPQPSDPIPSSMLTAREQGRTPQPAFSASNDGGGNERASLLRSTAAGQITNGAQPGIGQGSSRAAPACQVVEPHLQFFDEFVVMSEQAGTRGLSHVPPAELQLGRSNL